MTNNYKSKPMSAKHSVCSKNTPSSPLDPTPRRPVAPRPRRAGWLRSGFDCAAFRAEFARRRRMTVYERILEDAERIRAAHHERMAAAVRDHARRHPYLFRNKWGRFDRRRVEARARPDWWMDARLWQSGAPRLTSLAPTNGVRLHGRLQAQTEEQACLNLRELLAPPPDETQPSDDDIFMAILRVVLHEARDEEC